MDARYFRFDAALSSSSSWVSDSETDSHDDDEGRDPYRGEESTSPSSSMKLWKVTSPQEALFFLNRSLRESAFPEIHTLTALDDVHQLAVVQTIAQILKQRQLDAEQREEMSDRIRRILADKDALAKRVQRRDEEVEFLKTELDSIRSRFEEQRKNFEGERRRLTAERDSALQANADLQQKLKASEVIARKREREFVKLQEKLNSMLRDGTFGSSGSSASSSGARRGRAGVGQDIIINPAPLRGGVSKAVVSSVESNRHDLFQSIVRSYEEEQSRLINENLLLRASVGSLQDRLASIEEFLSSNSSASEGFSRRGASPSVQRGTPRGRIALPSSYWSSVEVEFDRRIMQAIEKARELFSTLSCSSHGHDDQSNQSESLDCAKIAEEIQSLLDDSGLCDSRIRNMLRRVSNFEKLVEEQNSILELALKQGIMESDGFGSPTARPSSTLTLNSVPMSAYKVRNNLRWIEHEQKLMDEQKQRLDEERSQIIRDAERVDKDRLEMQKMRSALERERRELELERVMGPIRQLTEEPPTKSSYFSSASPSNTSVHQPVSLSPSKFSSTLSLVRCQDRERMFAEEQEKINPSSPLSTSAVGIRYSLSSASSPELGSHTSRRLLR